MTRLTVLILLVFSSMGCSTKTTVKAEDINEMFEAAVTFSKAKLGNMCLVKALHESHSILPEKQEKTYDWVDVSGFQYRNIRAPDVKYLPTSILRKNRVTNERYGCSETIAFAKPEFVEIQQQGKRKTLGFFNLDKLCGPECGEEYSITFEYKNGKWVMDSSGLSRTGIVF